MDNLTASWLFRHRAALFETLERRALFSAGSLDSTFGQGGILRITDPQTLATAPTASAVQADGKALLAGNSQTDAGTVGTVARLTVAGQPDATFGQGGLLTLLDAGYDQFQVGALAVDSAGNVLLAGGVVSRHGVALAAVARLRPDGSLDSTFGDGGWATFYFGGAASVNALAVAPDGKILVGGGSTKRRSYEELTVGRLNADGSVDATFGTGGYVFVPFTVGRRHPGAANVHVNALAAQADGKVVAVGGGDRAVIARLGTDGSLDTAFGRQGSVSLAGRYERFTSVALAGDGEIVAAGGVPSGYYRPYASSTHLLVAAFTAGGQLDPAFGDGGEVVQFIGAGHQRSSEADAAGVRLTEDGKILVSGSVQNVYTAGPFLERLNGDGSVDQTFATGGIGVFPAGGVDFVATPPTAVGLLAEPDGIYVVPYDGPAAPFRTTGSDAQERPQLRATRFNADGSTDRTFGDNGLAEAAGPLGPGYDAVDKVAVTPAGDLAILGSTRDGRFLAHADANGTLDSSFGHGGEVVVPFSGAAVMTPDGNWVAITVKGYGEYGVTRYNADGTLDSAFGTDDYVQLGGSGEAVPPQQLYARNDGSVVLEGSFGAVGPSYSSTLFVVDASGNVAASLQKTDQTGDSFGAFGSRPEGDVFAVVYTHSENAPPTVSVARYHADLTPDTSFGVNGVASLAWLPGGGSPGFYVRDLEVAPDGSVYVVTDLGPDGSTAISRLTPAGQPDTSFAGSGYLRLYGNLRPTPIVQADGKLLLATTVGQTRTVTLSRYNADGGLDTGFGTAGQAVVDLGGVVGPGVSYALQTVGGVQELLVAGRTYFGPRSGTDPYHESDGFVVRVEL